MLHAVGAAAGWVGWRFSPRFRETIAANMTQAGYTDPALHAQAAREVGKAMAELPAIWMRPLDDVYALVREVQGWEHVEAAHAINRPIVFLTPHLGCFEITAQTYAHRTVAAKPVTVLFRPPRQAVLAPLMQAGRGRANMRQAPADLSGVRALLRALKNGEAVGLLPDQAPRFGEGVWAPFFGRMAYTMTLAHRLLRDGSALFMLAYGERLPQGRGFRVVYIPCEPVARDQEAGVAQINALIEGLIRRVPTQYLWAYKRYKVPAGVEPPPAVTTDGKPGPGSP